MKKRPCLICRFPTDADSASIFELGDGNESLQPRIPEAPIFELSDVARPLQPRIYEAPVSESDDEDIGLGLFGD
ncbi:hypothetical protein GLOIN_2v1770737 [Rhizophagus irregularis DAOM 181602=DAOM 197198]|nr:hypothetical protein GLOIN_2v1770737 [Rhizophagus irregularis DAOM 181602=DAOM 197198]POG74904.1 hypothetical protein GLOIN_2v1770737 [Rhizophagus irregularis DAOM 181602=DAOM 197198]|eukprot:XP_025181770.1 hypothetical protein GLOIN_2v1770737 [Rhizophagus irregularis DAOM 181602=DAOM 197198]